ncbi:hypothetical protein [Ensifer canadensis]
MDLHALKIENNNGNWELTSIEPVAAADIKSDDDRIFVAKEIHIDWLHEAIETHLNKEGNR